MLDAVATADRQRRSRDAVRRAAQAAPYVAGAVLLLALFGYAARWPPLVTVLLAVSAIGGLGALVLMARRHTPPTDTVAFELDKDAQLAGELRSAYWFASDRERDAFAALHLERAAERVQGVTWGEVYPPVRAGKSWATAAALMAGALALAAWLPARGVAATSDSDEASAGDAVAPERLIVEKMTPELREQLMKALAELDRAGASPAETRAAAGRVLDLADLDPELRAQLEKLLKDAGSADALARAASAEDRNSAGEMGDASASTDEQWAADDLAARLANESAQKNQDSKAGAPSDAGKRGESQGQKNQSQSGATGEKASQASNGERSQDGLPEMQFVDGEEFDESGEMMFEYDAPPPAGSSSAGAGPPSDSGERRRTAAEIARQVAQALRQELVEADKDAKGENVPNDQRRKTEAGRSQMGYTRTGQATYDPTRAGAAPQVPETRRPLVERYFVREPPAN